GLLSFFFFFQAEDGIRDFHVTGVQTCALPISAALADEGANVVVADRNIDAGKAVADDITSKGGSAIFAEVDVADPDSAAALAERSEERRVGKECRSRWAAEDYTKHQRTDGERG